MKLPKTILVVGRESHEEDYLTAGETLADISAEDGELVGTYQLIETGKVEVATTLVKSKRK